MASIEQKLREELDRFKQIGNNANNLDEQVLGGFGGGSGFVNAQGSSPEWLNSLKDKKN